MTKTILLTGGNGYLGNIILATLLSRTDAKFLLLLREKHSLDKIVAQLRQHMTQDPLLDPTPLDPSRIAIHPLPPISQLDSCLGELRRFGVDEIIHCAGSVEYFNEKVLEEINVEFTRKLLELGKELGIARFVHLSTAFAAGYTSERIPETQLPDPPLDPTPYTRTKRHAENWVLQSGIPYLILRPSVVVGDSRTGYYEGKPYGIYQVLRVGESLLIGNYLEKLHLLAPKYPLPLIHQDAFQEGFFAAYRHCAGDRILNLVSKEDRLPSTRDLCNYWVFHLLRPQEVIFYEKKEMIDFSGLTTPERTVIEFSAINFEIASHRWSFRREGLDELAGRENPFTDATAETLGVCQRRMFSDSAKAQEYLVKFSDRFPEKTRVVEFA